MAAPGGGGEVDDPVGTPEDQRQILRREIGAQRARSLCPADQLRRDWAQAGAHRRRTVLPEGAVLDDDLDRSVPGAQRERLLDEAREGEPGVLLRQRAVAGGEDLLERLLEHGVD